MRRTPQNRRKRLAIGAVLTVVVFVGGLVTNLHALEFIAVFFAMGLILRFWFFAWAGGRYEP
jgi:hypothetical protein